MALGAEYKVNIKLDTKEFDAQLEKMNGQDKHRYKDTRDKWQYAYNKVTKTKK